MHFCRVNNCYENVLVPRRRAAKQLSTVTLFKIHETFVNYILFIKAPAMRLGSAYRRVYIGPVNNLSMRQRCERGNGWGVRWQC